MSLSKEAKNGEQTLQTLLLRYQQYEADSKRTHQLVKDLLVYSDQTETRCHEKTSLLSQQLTNARRDLEAAANAQRDMQVHIRDLEMRMGYVPIPNPYAAVLIDGDGLVFKEKFIKQGHEGGQIAAHELDVAIGYKTSYLSTAPVKIIIKVVADVQALARDLTKNGYIPNEQTMSEFVASFNQTSPDADFVDVGFGKEKTAAKIFSSAKFHLRNINCKRVILGVGHNAGYKPYLEDLMRTEDTEKRLRILEAAPTVPAILDLGIDVINCHHLFRIEKIVQKFPKLPTIHPLPAPSTGTSYAAVAQPKNAPPPPEVKLPIAIKKPASSAQLVLSLPMGWNPGPRGLDEPIIIKADVMEKLKKKTGVKKLCNNHFLRGPCAKGDECIFDHDYKPTEEEKKVIAYFARLNPCANGQACVAENCIYGHHCPSVVSGACTHPKCKYAVKAHPPGTMFKFPKFPSKSPNSEES
ncbi:hypothetical protein F5B19DRAFT_489749 [Rostrohypoxylon terebratum]|nr:hypothetical protein F5B19DRAFT_489749 [Rostrohypoxylon terebratum]